MVGVTRVGLGGGDGCCSAGEACVDEVVLDADMAPVPVAEGADDGLLAAEAVAVASVSVRVGDSPSTLLVDAQDFVPGLVPGFVWHGDRVSDEQDQVDRRNGKRG